MSSFTNKFKSIRQDWNTPKVLFDKLNKEFNFEYDLAADSNNKLCAKFFSKENDGLKQVWNGVCWLNPPFGDRSSKMIDWIKKAYNDTINNPKLEVVMLIPARTNTKWWANYIMKAKEVRFICGRPKFGESKHGLPQPLVLVVFGSHVLTNFTSFYL